jgi:hypothetical protein
MNITVRIQYEMFASNCKQGSGENKFGSTRIQSYDHPHTNPDCAINGILFLCHTLVLSNKEWID